MARCRSNAFAFSCVRTTVPDRLLPVCALAAAKARDLSVVGIFANLLHDTLTTETDLHRANRRRLRIASHEAASTTTTPITHAYTRHLLAAAYSGSIAEIVAAVLPCQLGNAELGAALVPDYRHWAGSPYADWIRMYSAAEFAAGAEQLRTGAHYSTS